MKTDKGKVLIIIGPGGSGKSTLATYFAEKLGWELFEEDKYWVKHSWSGMRSEEQEETIQSEVFEDMLQVLSQGQNIVMDFILYKDPPNPLTNYSNLFNKNEITYKVVALKPSLEEIGNRMKMRGRENDLNNFEERLKDAEHQRKCLETNYIDPKWVVDSTNMTVEQLYQHCSSLIA